MSLPSTPRLSDLALLHSGAAALLRLGRFGGLSLAVLLVGCASSTAKTAPRGATLTVASVPSGAAAAAAAPARRSPAMASESDGAGREPAPDLATLADAVPVIEPIREARPYTVRGRSFVPQTKDRPHRESGLASWYGRKFHGRRTASGEVYDMHAMTAAHPTLPLPSYVRVRNLSNGKEVVVRVNDRGPFHAGRIIDLSYAAARKLGVAHGVGRVEIDRLTFDEIRTGAWRRAPAADGLLVAQLTSKPAALPVAQAAAPASTSAPEPLPAVPQVPEPAPRAMAAADPVGVVVLPMSGSATPVVSVTLPASTEAAPVLAALSSPVAAGPAAVPPTARAGSAPPGFWVQFGVFKLRDGAEHFHRRVVADLHWLAPVLAVLSETEQHRLQAGPYRSRDEAHGVAQRVREVLSLVPMVVERY